MKVSKRLRIQIPVALAKAYGIEAGDEVDFVVLQGNLVLVKQTKD